MEVVVRKTLSKCGKVYLEWVVNIKVFSAEEPLEFQEVSSEPICLVVDDPNLMGCFTPTKDFDEMVEEYVKSDEYNHHIIGAIHATRDW